MIIWQHWNKSCQVFLDKELNTWAAHLSSCPLLTKQLTNPRQIFQRIADCLFYFTTRFQLQHPLECFQMQGIWNLNQLTYIIGRNYIIMHSKIHNHDTSRIWPILSLITSLRKDQVLLIFSLYNAQCVGFYHWAWTLVVPRWHLQAFVASSHNKTQITRKKKTARLPLSLFKTENNFLATSSHMHLPLFVMLFLHLKYCLCHCMNSLCLGLSLGNTLWI